VVLVPLSPTCCVAPLTLGQLVAMPTDQTVDASALRIRPCMEKPSPVLMVMMVGSRRDGLQE
jgi:hypothetical protein